MRLVLIPLLSFCLQFSSKCQSKIIVSDTLRYTDGSPATVDFISSHSFQSEEMYQSCSKLQEASVDHVKEFDYEIGQKLMLIDSAFEIYSDSSFSKLVFELSKNNKMGQRALTKYYANGNILCQGSITKSNSKSIRLDTTDAMGFDPNYVFQNPHFVNQAVGVGKWTFYHENGELASKGRFCEPYEVRVLIIVDEDLNDLYEMESINYQTSTKDGKWKYFDKEGNLVLTEYYTKGKLIKFDCD